MHIYKHKYVPIYLRICMDRGIATVDVSGLMGVGRGSWERGWGEGGGEGGWGEGGGEMEVGR